MFKTEAETQNDSMIPGPSSTSVSSLHTTRRDQEVSSYMNNLPLMPPENYTFSAHQRTQQFYIFKEKRDQLLPNVHLDLYNASIIAVCM